jgi:drug/metabolite transporter (DMT)-like permease
MPPFGKNHSLGAYQHHVALITANGFFGLGAVVGALGLPATHPLMFAFVREVAAGILLLLLAVYAYGTVQPMSLRQALCGWRVHWKHFGILGLFVFGNQAGFIVGIKLAGPVTASVWQPSQPIMTAAICMACGMEPIRKVRVIGVLLAALGCMTMVLLKNTTKTMVLPASIVDLQDDLFPTVPSAIGEDSSPRDNGKSNTIDAGRYFMGNLLFFGNCLCTSLYIILSKRMLATFPAILVTAWSYNAAAICMLMALLMAASWPGGSSTFFCPECPNEQEIWYLPRAALPALTYYILFASVASYGLITWANQFATGTLVMSYTVLQPVTTAVLTVGLLITGLNQPCGPLQGNNHVPPTSSGACLEFPGWGALCGMAGVFTGLYLIIHTEPASTNSSEKEKGQESNANQNSINHDAVESETVALV